MGGAVSTGADNDELVDNLVEADYIKSLHVERVFRAVDRADYYLEGNRDSAYKDLAWKHGHLHLSAPCIYSEVLESLQLESGQSFLNLGSGTGYLSTMAGLIIGPYGVNHGIEIHQDVVDYARERLEDFKKKRDAFDEFDFCEPVFVVGNCLHINSLCRQYDRVYCGAACPKEHENYIRNLIAVGGMLVMPLNDQLLQIHRTSETMWETKNVLPVSFATLVTPGKEDDMIDLPEATLPILQDVCRITIRQILRANILKDFPQLKNVRKKKRSPAKKRNLKQRRVNIVPMSMGMMILDQFEDSDDDDGDERLVRRRRFLQTVAAATHDEEEEDDDEQDDDDDEEEDDDVEEGEENENGAAMEDDAVLPGCSGNKADDDEELEKTSTEDTDNSETLPIKQTAKLNGRQNGGTACRSRVSRLRGIAGFLANPHLSDDDDDSDDGDEGIDIVEMLQQSEAAIPRLSPPRKIRCSSNTSVDTSETSGLGSLGDDPLEVDTSQENSDKVSPGSSFEGSNCHPMDCTEPDSSSPRETVRTIMRDRIGRLPLPIALKSYIMYYRK